jgi:hypothetical protein
MSDIVRRHDPSPATRSAAKKAPAKKAAAKKTPAKKAPAKKAPAKKAAAKKAPAKKAPAKKAGAKKAPAEKRARTKTSPTAGTASVRALPAPPKDPFVVLGLSEPCSRADLRRSWRAYAARHHPDQGGDAATFARGHAAYEELIRRLS